MGDENPQVGGQVPPSSGQVPGAEGGSTPTTPNAPAGQTQLTHEQALDALEKVRKSEAAMRQRLGRLDELEAKEKAAQQAAMSLEEKYTQLQAEHNASLVERQAERTMGALERVAQQLGCIDPEFAAQGIDLSKVTYDKQGRPTNTDELMKEFLAKKSYLMPGQQQAGQQLPPPPTGGAAVNPGRSGSPGGHSGPISWETLKNMSQAEYTARYKEINQFYSRQTEENRNGRR